jgi:SAM-dependent methyltransferase
MEMRVTAGDPEYQRQLAAEIEFWRGPNLFVDAWQSAVEGPLKAYENERLSGDAKTPWYDVPARYGPFKRGLIIGAGGMASERRIRETNPATHLTYCDADTQALERRASEFGGRYAGLTDTLTVDLNFVEFPENTYDLIVSSSTLHHLINVEHVAAQINRALTSDGRFFLHDFVGESRFRFPRAQRRAFEAIYERERARRTGDRLPPVRWADPGSEQYSPFEAVRSDEILDIVRRELVEDEVRTKGAVIDLLLFAGLTPPAPDAAPSNSGLLSKLRSLSGGRRAHIADGGGQPRLFWETMLSEQCLRELALADELLCDTGLARPLIAFGIYRKRGSTVEPSVPGAR